MDIERELIANSDFADWTLDNPDNWNTVESLPNQEISEVGTGEGHGGTGTGYCNIYSTGAYVAIEKTITTVIGRKYRVSISVNHIINPYLRFEGGSPEVSTRDFGMTLSEVKTYSTTWVAITTTTKLIIKRASGATDVTIDDVSIKLFTFLGGLNRPLDYQFRRGRFAFA